MEPTSADSLQPRMLASTSVEDFRLTMIARFATCLMGELERGARVAHYRAPRIIAGIDLVVNYDLGYVGKQVEYALNTTAAEHCQKKLRTDYKVTLNAVNGQLRFAAYVRHA